MQSARLRHRYRDDLGTRLSCFGCEKKWRTIHSFQEEELQLKLGEIINKNMAKTAASVDNTLRDLLNSSYPTQSHSLIAK